MSSVKKGLIAAAGWSTRFLPSVKTYSKHLVPVLNKPNIQYQVEALVNCGIYDICIVHRPGEETLKRHFSPDPNLDVFLAKVGKQNLNSELNQLISQAHFTFIAQSPNLPYGNATPILAAKDFLQTDPFVYFYGDDLVIEDKIGEFLGSMLKTFDDYSPAVVAAVEPTDEITIQKLSTVKYKTDRQIEAILEKPQLSQIYSLDAMVSPFVMSSKILPLIANLPQEKGEIWNTTAINLLAQTDLVIAERFSPGQWVTTGDPKSWLLANLKMALKHPELNEAIQKLL